MIGRWLTAGVFEPGKGFAPTEQGSPQGGVISPLLLNVALHGLEEAAGVRYASGARAGAVKRGSPALVRYCDDFVVCCHTRQQAEQVKAQLAGWLAPRGLAFNEDKTRIVSLQAGYDFLGFNIRQYRNGKLLIKPSKAAVRRVKRKLADQMRRHRGQNVSAVLAAVCPITRGWASFYRAVVSKKTFNSVDDYLWKLTYKWARRSHPENRRTGSPAGTSASSTNPDPTTGCSATPPAAPTSPGWSGHPSSGTARSTARRPRTTPP
jgi:RNA-directed DNA polymerase